MGINFIMFLKERWSLEIVMLLSEFSWRKEVLQSRVPVLVDFWAEWCGPCRQMTPTIDALARDFKVCKVDIDKNQSLAAACNISSIPALLVIHQGKIVARHIGVTSEAILRADLNRYA
jgi:thioredoxin 1